MDATAPALLIRAYIATNAMAAIIGGNFKTSEPELCRISPDTAAKKAVEFTDALIAELNKP